MQISYLTKGGAAYYARMGVPEDLVPILKTQTRKQSLKTKDEAEAKRRLWQVITGWQREFDDVRTRRALVGANLEHAVWDHYTAVLERDEGQRMNFPDDTEIECARQQVTEKISRGEIGETDPLKVLDAALDYMALQHARELAADVRPIKLAELRKHLAEGKTGLIGDEADAHLRQNRLYVKRGTPDWISLARHMMRAEIDAFERTAVLDGLDEGVDGHGSGGILVKLGLQVVDGLFEAGFAAKGADQFNRGADGGKRARCARRSRRRGSGRPRRRIWRAAHRARRVPASRIS